MVGPLKVHLAQRVRGPCPECPPREVDLHHVVSPPEICHVILVVSARVFAGHVPPAEVELCSVDIVNPHCASFPSRYANAPRFRWTIRVVFGGPYEPLVRDLVVGGPSDPLPQLFPGRSL